MDTVYFTMYPPLTWAGIQSVVHLLNLFVNNKSNQHKGETNSKEKINLIMLIIVNC